MRKNEYNNTKKANQQKLHLKKKVEFDPKIVPVKLQNLGAVNYELLTNIVFLLQHSNFKRIC